MSHDLPQDDLTLDPILDDTVSPTPTDESAVNPDAYYSDDQDLADGELDLSVLDE